MRSVFWPALLMAFYHSLCVSFWQSNSDAPGEPTRTRQSCYTLAKDFLLQSGAGKGVTPESIEKYLHLSAPRPDTLAGL